jgi:hypothetical protein
MAANAKQIEHRKTGEYICQRENRRLKSVVRVMCALAANLGASPFHERSCLHHLQTTLGL